MEESINYSINLCNEEISRLKSEIKASKSEVSLFHLESLQNKYKKNKLRKSRKDINRNSYKIDLLTKKIILLNLEKERKTKETKIKR